MLESLAPTRRVDDAIGHHLATSAAARVKQSHNILCDVHNSSARGDPWPSDWDTIDFFMDESLVEDPYPYFEHLRAACPVQPLPHHGVVAVTGYDEATEVYRDVDTFSSCNSVIGPFATFPVPLEGDDVSEIIDRYRDQLPMHEHMVTMDPPTHTQERALLMRLITPKRLKDNEEFMWRLADRQLDEFIGDGHCEFISVYTQPFAMLVVADLLGVPEEDHDGSASSSA